MIIAPRCIGTVARAWLRHADEKFLDSWQDLCIFNGRYLEKWPNTYIHYTKGKVSWHSGMRNEIAKDMRGDWLFMLDTDHAFRPDVLARLLDIANRRGCDVLSGTYQYKHPPHLPVVCVQQEGAASFAPVPILDWDRTQEILPVLTVGAGCLLVRRTVFDRIKRETKEPPFDVIGGLSEDYSFCKRCKDLGITVWWAPRVECHHVIPHVLAMQDLRPAS